MKKLITSLAILLFLSGTAGAVSVTIEFKGIHFSPSEKAFKDIYGGGTMYGGEVSIDIWKNLAVWLGGSYFARKGELTFTKEGTKLTITPIGIGIKYSFPIVKMIDIYAGVGANYYSYKEENPIGKADKGGLGAVVKTGFQVNVFKGVIIDLFFNYTNCKIRPADFKINIGGTEVGAGLGYRF